MIKYFNKASKALTNIFKQDEEMGKVAKNIEDDIIALNPQIYIWKVDLNYDDDSFNQVFTHKFDNKFMVYNVIKKKIGFKLNQDKITDFKIPDYPSYSLDFLLTFSIAAKNWLSLDSRNILIVHDDLSNPKVLALICTVLAYVNKNKIHPMDIYSHILSTTKAFVVLSNVDAYKNITRYINYFGELQNNPIVEFKKYFISTVVIRGSPAADNEENKSKNAHYITINNKSFYRPVLRVISNEKVVYNSFRKGMNIEKLYYNTETIIKFNVNSFIFGDVLVEILHQQENTKFKQLFSIQLHTFFIDTNNMKFTKDKIDGVCKDIRYPAEFFVDIQLDSHKTTDVSTYDMDMTKWKLNISDFLMKSSKYDNNIKDEEIKEETENIDYDEKEPSTIDTEKEEEPHTITNLNISTKSSKAKESINSYNKDKNRISNSKRLDETDEDEDDIENYLKNLENKTK